MSMEDLKARQGQAPAVHTDRKPEDAAKDGSQFSSASPNAELENMQKKLDAVERTTGGSGAIPSAPKQRLLDAREVEQRDPTKRYRWVNVNNAEKAQLREAAGYSRVPVAEGGRQVGNLALFAIPRQVYDARIAELKKRHTERLSAHKREMENAAEAVERELRDRHGIKVNILLKE